MYNIIFVTVELIYYCKRSYDWRNLWIFLNQARLIYCRTNYWSVSISQCLFQREIAEETVLPALEAQPTLFCFVGKCVLSLLWGPRSRNWPSIKMIASGERMRKPSRLHTLHNWLPLAYISLDSFTISHVACFINNIANLVIQIEAQKLETYRICLKLQDSLYYTYQHVSRPTFLIQVRF